jgi:hypothetical protein
MKNPNCEEKSKKLGLPPPNTLIAKNLDVIAPNKEFSQFPQLVK